MVRGRPRLSLRFSIAAALLGGWLLFPGCGNDAPTGASGGANRVVEVTVRDISETVELTGEVVPAIYSEIKSEISGRIAQVHAEPGVLVAAGDLLVELDRTQLDTEVREAERQVEAARLNMEKALRDYERTRELFQRELVPQREYLDAQVARELAANSFEIQQARLESSKERLAQSVIRAPHAGLVLNHNLRAGQVVTGATSVSQGTVLMEVADMNLLYVETHINEVDITRVAVGMPARVSFDTIRGAIFEGAIETLSPSAIQRDQVRVFPTRIRFESHDPRIRPGISANVVIPVSTAEGVPAVIISAVFTERGSRFVFVREGEGFARRPVVTGISDMEFVEIREGLSPGEAISLTRPAIVN
ncbi:MAG: efflux RND transporter periplasmic adaptor subunit [Puniceicoccaceae bacterium]|nr:MAG: efflux RND transporter periplasmic adaptor subunit [Puniceicoccaceae bacterium]